MASQALQTRGGTRLFVGEDETQQEISQQCFCKEIRDFKDASRRFHEFFANAEGAHNPRLFDENRRSILEIIVRDACQYPKRYEFRNDSSRNLSKKEKAEYSAIVDEILAVSEMMVGKSGRVNIEIVYLTVYVYNSKQTSIVPLFKIYGNGRNDFVFISKNRTRYSSLLHFMDNNDLPHSLVCAAREGSQKTYEIDSVIKKYPLVFFTVNYFKHNDRMKCSEEHLRVWSTIYRNGIILDLPAYLVWALAQHTHVEVKYFVNNFDTNGMATTSLKYKFIKFVERHMDYIPVIGTFLNQALITAVSFGCVNGLILEGMKQALLLNGNMFVGTAVEFIKSVMLPEPSVQSSASQGLHRDGCPCSCVGRENPFLQLATEFKENRVESGTLNDSFMVIIQLAHIGNKLLETLEFLSETPKAKFTCLALRLVLRAAPVLVRELITKSKPINYIEGGMGNEVAMPDKGDYSYANFLKTYKEKDMERLLSDKKYVERYIESIYRECVASDEQNSLMMPINCDANIYVSLTPISVIIEELSKKSHQNVTVYASEDNSFYKISSEEAEYKIYPYKNDKLNVEPKIIYVEKK